MVELTEGAIRPRLESLAALGGQQVDLTKVVFEFDLPPRSLPAGTMAVYIFMYRGRCLKVGKAGPKSNARYVSHHYSPTSSRSNLAKSILAAPEKIAVAPVEPACAGRWVRENTVRVNILFPASVGIRFLTLVEAFMQCWLQPVYEGFETQG